MIFHKKSYLLKTELLVSFNLEYITFFNKSFKLTLTNSSLIILSLHYYYKIIVK